MTAPATVRLGEVASLSRDVIPPESLDQDTLYVGLEHIEPGGRIAGVGMVGASGVTSAKFVFDERHVLYGKLRPYLAKIAIPSFGGVCSTDILPLLPGAKLDRRYLAYFLRTPGMVDLAISRTSGANLPRLSPKELMDFPIPLPALEEQRRIADVLDRVDILRAKRAYGLGLLGVLPQQIFLQMFGDPVSNERGWPMVELSKVGALERGVSTHRPRNAPELLGGVMPLIQTGDVANSGGYIRRYRSTYSDLGVAQSRIWPVGTLCITIAANIAKTGILTFEACFPDSVVGFAASPQVVSYVRVWLSFLQESLERQAPESAQKNINLAILRSLKIPMPPLELIEHFSSSISALDSSETVQRRALGELDALFASLQHRAFRGEL